MSENFESGTHGKVFAPTPKSELTGGVGGSTGVSVVGFTPSISISTSNVCSGMVMVMVFFILEI
jgi:hypothetical protein